ncbi:MAG: VanZ family protein [Limisphaerales bacterium]|jgi:VanZ family protein
MTYWMPVILWAGIIFAFSTGLGASSSTSRFLGPLFQWLFPEASPETIAGIRFAIRKMAHACEYAGLSVLVWRAIVKPYGFHRFWDWMHARHAFLLCAAYAGTDELHQTFVAGRIGNISDVALDSFGALCGIAFVWCWWRYHGFNERLQQRP